MDKKLLRISLLSILILASCNETNNTSLVSLSNTVSEENTHLIDVERCGLGEMGANYFNRNNEVKVFRLEANVFSDTYYFIIQSAKENFDNGLPLPKIEVFEKEPLAYGNEGKIGEFEGGYYSKSKKYKGTIASMFLSAKEVVYLRYFVPDVKDKEWNYSYIFIRHDQETNNRLHDHYYDEFEWVDGYSHRCICSCGDSFIRHHESAGSSVGPIYCNLCNGPITDPFEK